MKSVKCSCVAWVGYSDIDRRLFCVRLVSRLYVHPIFESVTKLVVCLKFC